MDFGDDIATEIYHLFVAACYLFPLMGGILSDSYWGKVKTILVLGSVYQLGMILLTIGSLPQLSSSGIDPDLTNQIWSIVGPRFHSSKFYTLAFTVTCIFCIFRDVLKP